MKIHEFRTCAFAVGVLLIVIAAINATSVFGVPTRPANELQFLLDQQVPNSIVPTPSPGRSGLVVSYVITPGDPSYPALFSRSYIYDDALAVIAWSMEGQCQSAKNTLTALAGLIDADGKLGFSYNTHDGSFDGLYRTGAIAWVGYSFVFYQKACGDSQFQTAASRIADWVLTMQHPITGSVKGGPDVNWFSTEHNIDAYFFLRDIGLLRQNINYLAAANRIKQSLLTHHWNIADSCFQQGINDTEKALDAASWGALFLLSIGERDKALSCLNFMEANFSTAVVCDIENVAQNLNGYKPYIGTNVVWSEGSLGAAMAYGRVGNQAKRNELISLIRKMQGPKGGIIYACPATTDFPSWESIAGTTWLVILESGQQAAFWDSEAKLALTMQANPALVSSGASLTYTIRVTNTGSVTLTATITDFLPARILTGTMPDGKPITSGGVLTWTPMITTPAGLWTQQVVVTAALGYTGSLTNKVQVTTQEGVSATADITVCANACNIYLPLIFNPCGNNCKVYLPLVFTPPPWITVTASGAQASGRVGPPAFCNTNYKVALYIKTDIWYVQPYDDERRDVPINSDCTWQSFIHDINSWSAVAAHLVSASYYHPPEIGPRTRPCPPLNPATNSSILAWSCYYR